MMNKKTIILLILLVIISTTSGCGPGRSTVFNPYTGTQGVVLEFSEYMKTLNVKEEQEIPVEFKLKNVGAYSLNDSNLFGTLSIVESDPYLTALEPYTQNDFKTDFQIIGKSQDFPVGEVKYVNGPTYTVGKILGEKQTHNANFYITMCYPYKTTLTQIVCVDSDLYKEVANPICRNQKTYKYTTGQGAPISVVNIESEMLPRKITQQDLGKINVLSNLLEGGTVNTEAIQSGSTGIKPKYKITIKNEQKGTPFIDLRDSTSIFDRYGGNTCKLNADEIKSGVYVTAKLGNYKLSCNPSYINLNQQDSSICSLDDNDVTFINSNYNIPLTVEVYYNYKQTERKEIAITRTIT